MSNINNRVYTFKNALTEFTSIGKLDENGQRRSAQTNILLNPAKSEDKIVIEQLIKIFTTYSGYSEQKAISTFFKVIDNPGNDFHGFFKLKLRRTFFENTNKQGKKFFSPANIKGTFSEDVLKSSKKVDSNNRLVDCNPNYSLFVHDSSKGKTQCFTGKIWMYSDGDVNNADVQVVIEKLGKNGVQLTLFKYRKLSCTEFNSSNFKETVVQTEEFNDGLDDLFNESNDSDEDIFDLSIGDFNRGDNDLDEEDDVKW